MDFGIRRFFATAGLAVALVTLPGQAIAGPPLLCHPFDTDGAKSLPWGGDGWNSPVSTYPLDRLVTDTLALLSPEMPVVTRMETIRRAAIYASRDVRVAADLLSALSRRALERNSPKPDRHAWFDFGYLVETYKQADFLFKTGNPAAGIDGYRHITKAITMGSGVEPEMEFAAALVTERRQRDVANAHYRRAAAGATADSILARNLSARFPGR
ncbi:MAG: hypothetical protein ACRD09_12535 [Vicinamibacterales bacterium]